MGQQPVPAVKEPGGANLDRVQVIKGWRTADGTLREKVYNVVWGGNGRLRADGSLAIADKTGSIHQIGAAVQGLPSCNGWSAT